MLARRLKLGYAVIILVWGLLAVGVWSETRADYKSAQQHYLETKRGESLEVARHLETALKSIYENLRTLTFLPSIRGITRHGENLGVEGHSTIQQIYNNLASNVSVSEVYIVPAD